VYPQLTASAHSESKSESDDDEPENKRPRLDEGYEIALAAAEVPRSYKEAMASTEAAKWKEAMRSEIRSHVQDHTWDLVYRPPGVKVVGHKWVFARKHGENCEITRYKARLVAQGFLQTHGVDYTDTYSPVASMNTIRTFFSTCVQRGYMIRQFDVETAFLNGELQDTVYMSPPESVNIPDGMVCLLRRSVYGLKQAASVWFKTIRSVISSRGFVQCRADPCLFLRRHRDGGDDASPVLVVLYVDDLLVGCATEAQVQAVRDDLESHFKIKSLGDVRLVLGMEVSYARDKEGVDDQAVAVRPQDARSFRNGRALASCAACAALSERDSVARHPVHQVRLVIIATAGFQ
jgi:hypothetical protein